MFILRANMLAQEVICGSSHKINEKRKETEKKENSDRVAYVSRTLFAHISTFHPINI